MEKRETPPDGPLYGFIHVSVSCWMAAHIKNFMYIQTEEL